MWSPNVLHMGIVSFQQGIEVEKQRGKDLKFFCKFSSLYLILINYYIEGIGGVVISRLLILFHKLSVLFVYLLQYSYGEDNFLLYA